MALRIGVIANPAAAGHRRRPDLGDAFRTAVGDPALVIEPPDVGAIDGAVAALRASGVDGLAISGGDGTVHRVVTAIQRVYGGAAPPVALLPSGTMNTIARGVGVVGRPERALAAAVSGRSTVRPRTTIDVGQGRVGFLVGTGFWARFLRDYDARSGRGPLRAAETLGAGLWSTLVGGDLVRRWFEPFDADVVWDDAPLPDRRFTMVAAGTVDQVGLGFAPFRRVADHPGSFGALAFVSPPSRVAQQLPRLYRGMPPSSPDRGGLAHALSLRSETQFDWAVDGDPMPPTTRLDLRAGPSLRLWVP
jgi:diacylglycerol kinase (ATP)